MLSVQDRLHQLGIALPDAPRPVAQYAPWTKIGNLVFVAGQLSFGPGGDVVGVLGADADLARGQEAARLCGLNIISQLKQASDDHLDRVRRVGKLTGYFRAQSGFGRIPLALDGCSSLLLEVFGDAGRHARTVVGVQDLPRNCLAEVDAIVELAE